MFICISAGTHMPRFMCGGQQTTLASTSLRLLSCLRQGSLAVHGADVRLAGPQASSESPISLKCIWVLDAHYYIQLYVGPGVQALYPLSHFPCPLP